ncbi:lipopolysaccharide assembly LapA domain-containing protein [Mycobacterium sp.]|uniref:LapA family protein n=1 Tax=Mycobacterium sp. TaxID=1785 RepID=UPI00126AE813|nr:lipopolysaccharide assembly LapA domain-containing protein [Mycobacterium sp.]KAA8957493.1 MAG: DUF1049 domain-containing protein [Mycobacterium sp.]
MSSDTPGSPGQPHRPPTPPHDAGSPQSSVALTRAAAVWTSLIAGFLILTVLLIFITQNNEPVPLTFLGWHWHLPLGVAVLLAAVGGGLITVLAGTTRIYQLRRAAKRQTPAGR